MSVNNKDIEINQEHTKTWIMQNKPKINNYARLHYLKKLKDLGDEYRTKLNEKNKEARKKKKSYS